MFPPVYVLQNQPSADFKYVSNIYKNAPSFCLYNDNDGGVYQIRLNILILAAGIVFILISCHFAIMPSKFDRGIKCDCFPELDFKGTKQASTDVIFHYTGLEMAKKKCKYNIT